MKGLAKDIAKKIQQDFPRGRDGSMIGVDNNADANLAPSSKAKCCCTENRLLSEDV